MLLLLVKTQIITIIIKLEDEKLCLRFILELVFAPDFFFSLIFLFFFGILLVSGRRRRPAVTINPRVLCFPAINGIICGFWAVVWAGGQKRPPFTRQMNWPSIHKRFNCLYKLILRRRQDNLKGGKKLILTCLLAWKKSISNAIASFYADSSYETMGLMRP